VVEAWSSGELEGAVALDVFEAAAGSADPDLASLAASNLALRPSAPVASRRWAREGGDPAAGRIVFETHGDCMRCHGGGGHGAGAGPDLSGVGGRGADHVLESILTPQAQIASGYGSVVVTRRDGTQASGTLVREDEEGLVLEPAALRDVVAYVLSLEPE